MKQGRRSRGKQVPRRGGRADYTVWPLGRTARVWYGGVWLRGKIVVCTKCGRRGVAIQPPPGRRWIHLGAGLGLPPVVIHRVPASWPSTDMHIFAGGRRAPEIAAEPGAGGTGP